MTRLCQLSTDRILDRAMLLLLPWTLIARSNYKVSASSAAVITILVLLQ